MKDLIAAAVAAAGLGLAVGATAAPPPAPVPPAADLALGREILKELIEVNSTHSHGTTAVAHRIEARLLAAGFAPADVEFIAPPEHPNSGNVVVRVHGSTRQKPVLFLGHLDVVEARPEDWTTDPFRLVERDGYYYARGTIDMKDGDAAMLESLIRMKRAGYTPKRDLIVAFTADEEAGGDANGPAFLLSRHRALIDAGVVINPDGGGGTIVDAKRSYLEVGTSEKTYVTFSLETTGPGGHGSLPGADNPIYRLTDGLARLERYQFPVILTTTTRASFKAFADLLGGPDAADMRAVAATPIDLAAAERLSRAPYLNAQLRTTCVATLISGGHAENALPQRAKATIQCRMMPGDTADNVEAQLRTVLADAKISLTLDAPPIVSPESLPTPELMALVGGVAHSMWPGIPLVPTMATGFSDDRQTRNAGIPSYDVSGIFVESGENRAHGRDERVGVVAFDESVEFMFRLMKALGDAETGVVK